MAAKTHQDIRLILLGKTGVGKSATGNTLAGKKVFVSRPAGTSVTKEPEVAEFIRRRRNVKIVDTPGIFDNTMAMPQVVEGLVSAVSHCAPGPHAFLIVLAVGRFTPEEYEAVEKLKELFGSKMIDHSVVILTRVDDLRRDDMSLQQYKDTSPPELQDLIDMCGNRCFAVDNTADPDSKASKHALDSLMDKVEMMCEDQEKNGEETHYSIDNLEEATKVLKEAKERLEMVVQKQAQQEEHQLVGSLANKLNRLHDKHREIIHQQEITKETISSWIKLRGVTVAQLQCLKTKGKLAFEGNAKQQVQNLRRLYPWASVLIKITAPLLWLFSLKKLYKIPEEEVKQLNAVLEADDKQTTMLADALNKLEQMKTTFTVPPTPKGLEEHFDSTPFETFQKKLQTMPTIALSNEDIQSFGLEVEEGDSSVTLQTPGTPSTGGFVFLSWRQRTTRRKVQNDAFCIRVKPHLQRAMQRSGEVQDSRCILDKELDKICAMLMKDTTLKHGLYGHWFQDETSHTIDLDDVDAVQGATDSMTEVKIDN